MRSSKTKGGPARRLDLADSMPAAIGTETPVKPSPRTCPDAGPATSRKHVQRVRRARLRIRRLLALTVLAGSGTLAVAAVAPAASGAGVSPDWVAACGQSEERSAGTASAVCPGGLRLSAAKWQELGGHAYAPDAAQATKAQQIEIAEKLLRLKGPFALTAAFHHH